MPFLREKSGKLVRRRRSSPSWARACRRCGSHGAPGPATSSAARPINDAIHSTGNYAVWLVILSLAVTPARRLFNAPKLINMRRTLGVAAFCYAVLHLTLYVVQEKYDLAKVASEIVFRFYLTLGFVALIGLIALATTSTDGMIKRLGGARWNKLHKLVYAIAILGIIHFLMQTKLDISESVMVAGFLFWLLGYRLIHRYMGEVTTSGRSRSRSSRRCSPPSPRPRGTARRPA